MHHNLSSCPSKDHSLQQKILDQITAAPVIICLRKKSPDGNALGAQFGLKSFIQANWPAKEVYAPGDANDSLSFLGTPDVIPDAKYKDALVIVLGVPERKFLTVDWAFLKANAKLIVRIDHHPLSDPFADLDWVDPTSPSTTQMLALLVVNRPYLFPKLMARNWFAGLVTDTAQFNYGLIDHRTGTVLQFLLAQNFDVQSILQKINNRTPDWIAIETYVLQNINYHNQSGLVSCVLPAKIIGSTPTNSLILMIRTLWDVSNAAIVALITLSEDEKTAFGQIRAVNSIRGVPALAENYGGGGHNWAAGTKFCSSRIPQFLTDLEKLIISSSN